MREILLSLVTVAMMIYVDDAYATHTSIPVIEPLHSFIVNKYYELNGFVLYNGQPTSDVLVEVTLSAPDGSTIKEYVRSSSDGSFRVKFTPTSSGYYTLTAVSYCRDVHRDICTNQSTTMQLLVLEEITKDICIVDECIGVLSAQVVGIRIDHAELHPDDKLLRLRLHVDGGKDGDEYMLLKLPRSIIDSEQGLVVSLGDFRFDYKEYIDGEFRVIEARLDDVPTGTVYMDIIGTYAIPEFSSYLALISMLMVPLLTIIYKGRSCYRSHLHS